MWGEVCVWKDVCGGERCMCEEMCVGRGVWGERCVWGEGCGGGVGGVWKGGGVGESDVWEEVAGGAGWGVAWVVQSDFAVSLGFPGEAARGPVISWQAEGGKRMAEDSASVLPRLLEILEESRKLGAKGAELLRCQTQTHQASCKGAG